METMKKEMAHYQTIMDEAQDKVDRLRPAIVTSLDFKLARKALRRAQEMADVEQQSRQELTQILTQSFVNESHDLPHATTLILLAYLWRKYDSITAWQGYYAVLSRMGALKVSLEQVEAILQENSEQVVVPLSSNSSAIRNWSDEDVAQAVATYLSKPGSTHRPPVVEFSYIRWANYSAFPDCGETALRNLINQLIYDPTTGLFSADALEQLRAHHYPNMHTPLIDFYRRHPNPQEAADHGVSRKFLDVVCHLNDRRDYEIRYRREKEQANIASPLGNLLRAFQALFGLEDEDKELCVAAVADKLNAILDTKTDIDMSGIKADGFGILGVTVFDGSDEIKFELQSYKPVHFGFVQVASSSQNDRRLYRMVQQLHDYVSHRRTHDTDVLENVALASLFVPFLSSLPDRRRRHLLDLMPPAAVWLFADLHSAHDRKAFLQSLEQHPQDLDKDVMDKIQNYQEPTFMPQKKQAE
jgi:hypothetical protein